MITKIAIENFKGIGERVEVELRPLTLLFGPNSAGKSSILHALHYAREIFERQNINPDRTIAGGGFVDLGGFPAFVHNHDLGQEVKISIQLDLRGIGLPDYGHAPGVDLDKPGFVWDQVMNCRKVELAEVTVSIAWCDNLRQPYVRMYSLTLGGQWICRIECENEIDEARLVINSRHHVFWRVDDCPGVACILEDSDDVFPGLAPEFPETTRVTEDDSAVLRLLALAKDLNLLPIRIEDGVGEIRLPAASVLPSWHASSISLPFNFDAVLDYLWPPGKDRTEPFEMPAIPECGVRSVTFTHDSTTYVRQRLNLLATKLDAVLTEIVIGPCRRAYEAFQKFRYVGPLRETPARTYLPPRYPDPSRWACGLGAWDELHTGSPELVQAVSRCLGDSDRLDAGYRVQRKEFKEVELNDPIVADFLVGKRPDETADQMRLQVNQLPTQSKLIIRPNGRNVELSPHDVGVGISQVIPVVVTALADREHLVVIEQPELHLHPRLQANLGDLFIEAAVGERKQTVILETHSEHLLLRLLRRIRETSEGTLPDGCQSLKPDQITVVYVESVDGNVRVTRLHVTEDGDFAASWPGGFFDERAKELF